MSGPRIPVSTYRLQFNQHLRFNDAREMIAYLRELGITDLYASPLLQAKRGSMHGYDVADPSHLNSELGTDEEFDGLVRELEALEPMRFTLIGERRRAPRARRVHVERVDRPRDERE